MLDWFASKPASEPDAPVEPKPTPAAEAPSPPPPPPAPPPAEEKTAKKAEPAEFSPGPGVRATGIYSLTRVPSAPAPPSASSSIQSRTKSDRTTDKEVGELKELFGRRSAAPAKSPPKARSPSKSPTRTSPPGNTAAEGSQASSSLLSSRPKWDNRPMYNPPGNLRGVKPYTKEPWSDVAQADMAIRMEFGSRDQLGLPDYEDGPNGLKLEAADRRKHSKSARPWNSSVVRHEPPVLRGQRTIRRAEPWSEYHNDNIDMLNAIDDTSVNELYAITADRDNRVKPTLVQPAWDSTPKFGRKSKPPGGDLETKLRAQTFRDQRRAFTRAGAPVQGGRGTSIAPYHGQRYA